MNEVLKGVLKLNENELKNQNISEKIVKGKKGKKKNIVTSNLNNKRDTNDNALNEETFYLYQPNINIQNLTDS